MSIKPKKDQRTRAELRTENQQLRARLSEVEQALAASPNRVLREQQQALGESEDRLSLAAIAGQVGIFDWNVITGELQWTPQHAAIFGYAPTTTARTHEDWRQRVHPNDLPWVEAQIRREMPGTGRFESEYRIVWPDGGVHWVEVTAKFDHDGEGRCVRMLGAVRDSTERKLAEREHETTIEFLRMINESSTMQELIDGAVSFFQHQTGCAAVGIRLQDGDDFPYFRSDGFPAEFLRAESSLHGHDLAGEVFRDEDGNPLLECLCGTVIRGSFDPKKPFFTANGSFWTNSTTELQTSTPATDRPPRIRHRCHRQGYESVALIPLRDGDKRLGLIQLNDTRPGMFSARNIHLWERLFGYLAVAIAKFKADAARRESQRQHELLAKILEDSSQPFAVGYPDGKIGRCNKAFQQLTGYSEAELHTLDWQTALTPPEWRALEEAKVAELNRTGRAVSYEKEYLRKDGSRVAIELLVHFVADALGHPEYYYAFVTDISERKRAEAALLDAKLRVEKERDILHAVMNVATNMHLVYLDRDFNFVCVNETYARTCGYRPEEMTGKNHFALYPHPENEAIFRQVRDTGEPVAYHDKPFTFPDQPERGVTYWDWLLAPVKEASGAVTGLVFSLFETTARKKIEESLRLKRSALEDAKIKAENDRRLLLTVMEALPVGVAITDLHGGTTQANSAFKQIWGDPRPPTGSAGGYGPYQAWWPDSGDLVAPEEWTSTLALQWEATVDGQLFRIQRPDGSEAFVLNSAAPIRDVEGVVVGCAVATQDITELKQTEASLRESEALFRGVFQSAAVGIVKATASGRIQLVNDAYCRMLGRSRQELVGRKALEITHPGDFPVNTERTRRPAAAGEIKDYTLEKRYQRGDGSTVWVNLSVTEVADEAGHHLHNIAVVEDISVRKAAEERLLASLREKEVLLKEIHHRVKNNLQVISSLVDLQADSIVDPALSGLFQDVRDRVRSMALVHEKLYSSDSLVQINFAEYTSGLLDYLWRAHGSSVHRIRLTLDLEPLSLAVETAVPCGLLLNELAVNALKHAFVNRDSGEVVVALHAGPGDVVHLRVNDNGVGLPAEGLDWRPKGSLGLSLVLMLTKQLKGTVEVANSGGAQFHITFPFGARGREG